MPHNYLVTGPPRSGKTTAIERAVARLRDDGYEVGGVYSPEVRESGERVGFDVVDALSGDRAPLARVEFTDGPRVGRYRVAVEHVETVAAAAVDRGLADADAVVVDEIAPMQVESDAFVAAVRRALDAETPVVAAVQYGSGEGFVGAVKRRDDAELFEVTPETRDDLPAELAGRVRTATR